MRDFTQHQLGAIQQIAINAASIVLGTLILGGFFAATGFSLTLFSVGTIIYVGLIWGILEVAKRRKQ